MERIMNYKNIIRFVAVITSTSLLFTACGKASSGKTYPRFESGENEIISYTFTSQKNSALAADIEGAINGDTIEITLPHGTDVTSLVAQFVTNSTDVTVKGVPQVNGETANDFSSDIVYTVTAENDDVREYTVKVVIAPSTEKIINTFYLNGTEGVIDQSAGTIEVSLPPKTALSGLVATFTAVCKSVLINGSEQMSGVTENSFESDVTYTVEAEDGSTRTYTVKASVQKADWKEISAFSFSQPENPGLSTSADAVISGTEINLVLPYGSATGSLVASFTHNGETVSVNGTPQESGVTENDFSGIVEYIVTAEDGSEQTYSVTVTVAKNDAKAITSFTLDGETSVINQEAGTITTSFPETKSITALIASFATTGESVTVDGTEQVSGASVNDFSSDQVYRVYAEDGSVKDYTVSVTRSAEIAGLWNFDYSGSGDYTIFEAVQVPGVSGSALQFDGYNDYVLVPDDPSLTLAKAGSIEATFRVISHKPYAGIVHKGVRTDFNDETFSLQYWTTAGKLRFIVTNDDNEQSFVDSSTTLELNTWYHIVATWDVDAAAIKIYINGAPDCEGEITTGDVRDSNGALVIGAQLPVQYSTTWGNLGFNGLIDRVQLLNRALTPEEVSARYSAFAEEESGLTAFIFRAVPGSKGIVIVALLLIAAAVAGIYAMNRIKHPSV